MIAHHPVIQQSPIIIDGQSNRHQQAQVMQQQQTSDQSYYQQQQQQQQVAGYGGAIGVEPQQYHHHEQPHHMQPAPQAVASGHQQPFVPLPSQQMQTQQPQRSHQQLQHQPQHQQQRQQYNQSDHPLVSQDETTTLSTNHRIATQPHQVPSQMHHNHTHPLPQQAYHHQEGGPPPAGSYTTNRRMSPTTGPIVSGYQEPALKPMSHQPAAVAPPQNINNNNSSNSSSSNNRIIMQQSGLMINQEQQYQPTKRLKPRDQQVQASQYQHSPYGTNNFPDGQYQSSSPTLLQQQLNRAQTNQSPYQQGRQRASAGQYHPARANHQPGPAQFEPTRRGADCLAEGLDANYSQQSGDQLPQPTTGEVYHYQPGGLPVGVRQPPVLHHHHQQQQQQQQVRRPGHLMTEAAVPVAHSTMPQTPHMIVGNPTPPLTPTSHPVAPNATGRLQQSASCASQQQPMMASASDQWLPNHHQANSQHQSSGLQYVQQAPYGNGGRQQQTRTMSLPMAPKGSQQQATGTFQQSNGRCNQQQQPLIASQPGGGSLIGQHQLGPVPSIQHHGQAAPPMHPADPHQHPHHMHPHQHPHSHPHQYPSAQTNPNPNPHHQHQQQYQAQATMRPIATTTPSMHVQGDQIPSMTTRLTLPLRDTPLLGPFKLDHDAQIISKVFHIKPQLFSTLSKSSMMNPNQAIVIQELQFKAYLINQQQHQQQGPSNKSQHQAMAGIGQAKMHQHHHHHHHHHPHPMSGDSLLAPNNHKQQSLGNITRNQQCNWPELFQLSINQNIVHIDRTINKHKALDIFQYCQPGDNILEIQVNDCYCSHEFILEAVDRPTLKAFINSCFKSRLLSLENCIQKLRFNFGSPGFLMQQQHTSIINDYINEGLDHPSKVRISMKCLLATNMRPGGQQSNPSVTRMRTPTRGHNCKHLQCFDLDNFLMINCDKSQWYCPICYLPIPFNMLELDQHQMNILQALGEMNSQTDDILMDSQGQWQIYHFATAPPIVAQSNLHQVIHHHGNGHHMSNQTQQTAKSTGIYHPQAPQSHPMSSQTAANLPVPSGQPMRPMSGPSIGRYPPMNSSPQLQHQQQHIIEGSTMRRPASTSQANCDGRRSASLPEVGGPLVKRVCTGPMVQQYNPPPAVQQQQQQHYFDGNGVHDVNIPNPQVQASSSTAPLLRNTFVGGDNNSDDLSPLAAMERTIIQHEQQMGPPPFDPNSLTSQSGQARALVGSSTGTASGSVDASSANPMISHQANTNHINQQQTSSSVLESHNAASQAATGKSSMPPMVPSSPHQQRTPLSVGGGEIPPGSPMHYNNNAISGMNQNSSSTPATPVSSNMLLAHGPETPATPSNSCGQTQQNNQHSQQIGQAVANSNLVVDHQPLSNGSASAGSITSSSTMTPSGQSLGSVGMGGDSRCGTAPLQLNGTLGGLDDLMLAGSSQGFSNNSSSASRDNQFKINSANEKNEILMGKLMMDSSQESLLHRTGDQRCVSDGGELALALEEAEWKQQLDRGKSEHLANFLNEPLMKKQQHQNQSLGDSQQQQQQQHGANKMLSGGLNPSDDEANNSHDGSPLDHQSDQQMNEFNNYLDSDGVDNGTGLPPDDSILDLFER